MMHHLDQAEHRAENADGGREAAGRFKDRGQTLFVFGNRVEAYVHDFAQLGGLGAVNGQHQRLFQKRILDGLQIGVERDHALAAGLVGERDKQLDNVPFLLARRGKDVAQAAKCGEHGGERKLQQHRAQRAAKYDQSRGGLQNLAQVSAFNQQTCHDSGDGQQNSANARLIHKLILGPSRR